MCQVLIDNSIPRVTIWFHEAPPSDENSDPNDRFLYQYLTFILVINLFLAHPWVPTVELNIFF